MSENSAWNATISTIASKSLSILSLHTLHNHGAGKRNRRFLLLPN
jgi:hypothetical protein